MWKRKIMGLALQVHQNKPLLYAAHPVYYRVCECWFSFAKTFKIYGVLFYAPIIFPSMTQAYWYSLLYLMFSYVRAWQEKPLKRWHKKEITFFVQGRLSGFLEPFAVETLESGANLMLPAPLGTQLTLCKYSHIPLLPFLSRMTQSNTKSLNASQPYLLCLQ